MATNSDSNERHRSLGTGLRVLDPLHIWLTSVVVAPTELGTSSREVPKVMVSLANHDFCSSEPPFDPSASSGQRTLRVAYGCRVSRPRTDSEPDLREEKPGQTSWPGHTIATIDWGRRGRLPPTEPTPGPSVPSLCRTTHPGRPCAEPQQHPGSFEDLSVDGRFRRTMPP